MDTKRMITGMMLAMMVILGYQIFISWLWKKNNWKAPGADTATTQQVSPTTATTGESPTVASATTAPGNASPTTAPTGIHVVGASKIESAAIGSGAINDPTFAMGLNLIAQGAAIDQVTLNQFKLKVGEP